MNETKLTSTEKNFLAYLSVHKTLGIKTALEQFKVSRMTIYRTFKHLESLKYVRLERGCAHMQLNTERDFASQMYIQDEQKKRIAMWTSKNLIPKNSSLMLEAGTTVAYTLKHLVAREPIAVLSNGIDTLRIAMDYLPNTEIIGSGGTLRRNSHSFVGSEAADFFANHKADIVLLSSTGCHLESGFMDINKLEGEVKRSMLANAATAIMIIDSSKINTYSVSKFADINEIDILVTGRQADPSFMEAVRQQGVETHLV